MWPFSSPATTPPPIIAPEVQRAIAVTAHERLGVAVSLIQSGVVRPDSKPESIFQLTQRLRTELGLVASSNVESSPIYLDASPKYRQEVGNRLRMMRALLEGAAKKTQDKTLLQRGVNSEKTAVLDDIHQDFVLILGNIRAIERLLQRSEQQRAA